MDSLDLTVCCLRKVLKLKRSLSSGKFHFYLPSQFYLHNAYLTGPVHVSEPWVKGQPVLLNTDQPM